MKITCRYTGDFRLHYEESIAHKKKLGKGQEIAMYIRKEVERIIKEQSLDRNRIFEVSKIEYKSITKKIENTFVSEGGTIDWSNMGYFKPNITCEKIQISGQRLWYHSLAQIIPMPEKPVYVLLEDSMNCKAKYWLYEMYLSELIAVLDDVVGLDDFYIVSKKYEWLISENHEEIAAFLGGELDCSVLKNAE